MRFVSFWYCGVFFCRIELSHSYIIVVQKSSIGDGISLLFWREKYIFRPTAYFCFFSLTHCLFVSYTSLPTNNFQMVFYVDFMHTLILNLLLQLFYACLLLYMLNFVANFLLFLLFQVFGVKNIKINILSSVWSAQHPKAGRNVQQSVHVELINHF